MEPFDISNMGSMLGMMQQRIADMKTQQEALRCEGTAGGGLVKVEVTGTYDVVAISISDDAMGDRELLEDLVRAATSEALRKVRDETAQLASSLTGGLPIPPGLLPF